MAVKTVAQRQLQRLVDEAVDKRLPALPSEGWLRTVRKALGMSGAQLAKRLKVTRARVAQAELAERSGAATIKSMRTIAEAMGCHFVYAIVPPERTEDLILAQARKKAKALVGTASEHMALEDQSLSEQKITEQVDQLAREFAQKLSSDLWDDK